jgi:lipopolysaccharide transport system ATP-binding protein
MNQAVNPEKKRPLIELNNAGLCYRLKGGFFKNRSSDFWAIRGVNLKVYDGDKLAIIGRNGAGKSTLMSMLAGVVLPDEGKAKAKNVSRQLLTLQLGFEQALTGEENAVLGGLYLGRTNKQMMRALPAIYQMSELGDFFYQPLSVYSNGMKARLGFAVAMESNPDVLLLDEVMGTVGDEAFREKSKAIMKEKMEKQIKTLILVTHNTEIVSELCNRAVLLENGKILVDGSVEEVLSHYDVTIKKPGRNVVNAPKHLQRVQQPWHLQAFKWFIDKVS